MREELMLSPEIQNLGQVEYDDIQMAIQKLSSASQEQFEEIKQEKWYNRLWDMVTFSQKGKKRLAEQIGTVAQAQQILVEMLLRLSDQDRIISELVMKNTDYIERIQHENIYLLTEINLLKDKIADINVKVKYDANIKDLNDEEKRALSGCLYNLAELNDSPSDRQKEYLNTILNYVDENTRMENPFAAIENLDSKIKGKILVCCMEYMFLEKDSTDTFDKYQEFIDEFDCGKKTISDLKEQVESIYKARGEQGFIDRYRNIDKGVSASFFVELGEDSSEDDGSEEDYDEITNKGIEGLVEFYGAFEDSKEDEQYSVNENGIIIDMKVLKMLSKEEKNTYKITSNIAPSFLIFSEDKKISDEVYETNNDIIYESNNQIYFYSKITKEPREFDIKKLIIKSCELSEATSNDIFSDYIYKAYNSIKEYRNGFFFAIGTRIFYVKTAENEDTVRLVVDLSNICEKESNIKIKGIESKYFIFSYKKNVWCLLNIETGELLCPSILENRTDKFIVEDDYIYYLKVDISTYKKNMGQQYKERTDAVQVFQCNLITGKENPASKKIYNNSKQQDGLGMLEVFEKIDDKYIIIRRTHFSSNGSVSLIGLLLSVIRGSYLYMVFDSHFNCINNDSFQEIDDNNVFRARYCGNGIVIYEDSDMDIVKIFSVISGRKKTIGNGNIFSLRKCGNYCMLGNDYKTLINLDDF